MYVVTYEHVTCFFSVYVWMQWIIQRRTLCNTAINYDWYLWCQAERKWKLCDVKTYITQKCKSHESLVRKTKMTSWRGNCSRINGPLWGESTGHRWIPLSKEFVVHLLSFWTKCWTNRRSPFFFSILSRPHCVCSKFIFVFYEGFHRLLLLKLKPLMHQSEAVCK